MEQNKTAKYFKYAIGEIVLVVIGILIALQINNWNENRINKVKEGEYLIGLKTDLEKQIKLFQTNDQFYDFVINKGESILMDYSLKGHLLDIDSINSKLSQMMYVIHYPEVKTAFNELNTTGQINLIKKKALRSNIIEYYQNSESAKLSVDNNIDKVYYNQLFPIIRSAISIHFENFQYDSNQVNKQELNEKLKPVFDKNLSNPAREFEIINAVSLRIIVAKTNNGHIVTNRKAAELLLKEINMELDSNNYD